MISGVPDVAAFDGAITEAPSNIPATDTPATTTADLSTPSFMRSLSKDELR